MEEEEEGGKCNLEEEEEEEEEEEQKKNRKCKNVIEEIAEKLKSAVEEVEKIEAAREIRKLVRKSSFSGKTRSRFAAAGVIPPLVDMLQPCSYSLLAREAALLALLNLASRNERFVLLNSFFFFLRNNIYLWIFVICMKLEEFCGLV